MTPEVDDEQQQQAKIVYCSKSGADSPQPQPPRTAGSEESEREEQEDQLSLLPKKFERPSEQRDGELLPDPQTPLDKRHFNRLNPNRRSLSSPNVSKAASFGPIDQSRAASANRKSKQFMKRLRRARPTSLADGKLVRANEGDTADELAAPARLNNNDNKSASTGKLRRRTALGLISTTFRLNNANCPSGASPISSPPSHQEAKSTEQTREAVPPATTPTTAGGSTQIQSSSSNSWRSWFSVRNFLLSSSSSSSDWPAQQSNQNNEPQLVKSSGDHSNSQVEQQRRTTTTISNHKMGADERQQLDDLEVNNFNNLEAKPNVGPRSYIDNLQFKDQQQQQRQQLSAITKQSGGETGAQQIAQLAAHNAQCKLMDSQDHEQRRPVELGAVVVVGQPATEDNKEDEARIQLNEQQQQQRQGEQNNPNKENNRHHCEQRQQQTSGGAVPSDRPTRPTGQGEEAEEELIQLNGSTRLDISLEPTTTNYNNVKQQQPQANNLETKRTTNCVMPTTTTATRNSWLPSVVGQRSATTNCQPQDRAPGPPPGSSGSHIYAEPMQSLVDRLVDSQLEWRQLISEANQGEQIHNYLSECQIKRQEIIHELIKTERHHCLTLALMRQVYLSNLAKLNEARQQRHQQQHHEAHNSFQANEFASEQIDLERLFPALEELIQAHELFFAHLRLRLVECCQPIADRKQQQLNDQSGARKLVGLVGQLGDLLVDQFRLQNDESQEPQRRTGCTKSTSGAKKSQAKRSKSSPNSISSYQSNSNSNNHSKSSSLDCMTNGQKLLQAYGRFCGQHAESSRYYKQLMQHDKAFKQVIEQCNKQHAACRQRGIPECNLLVTQRLTKYPLLIEQLIKCSKDEPNDEENKLRRALAECRALLAELNSQLARKESFERLLDIYAQFSPKSHTIFHHKLTSSKFTKHDLLQHKRLRQLLHSDDQIRLFSAQRRKLFQILCLILNDLVVFLRVEQSSGGSGTSDTTTSTPAGSGQATLSSHHHHQQQHSTSSVLLSAACDASHEPAKATTTTTNHHQQVKYYFANIDNKSSVISLSKLLIREKAVEDTEPRVYLISSSPRQPEMYELAFMSRRHRSNFTEKLRGAIERHQEQAANSIACWPGQAATTEHDELDTLANCSSCSSMSELFRLESSRRTSCECCCDTNSSSGDDDDDDDGQPTDKLVRREQQRDGHNKASHSTCELDQLELDIEQDVMPAPSRDADNQSTCSSASSSCSSISTIESTKQHRQPAVSSLDAVKLANDHQSEENNNNNEHEHEAQAEDEEEDDDHPCESGLSERARDSCDEQVLQTIKTNNSLLANTNNSGQQTTTLRQKIRRRRLQRPRQVSNQSTSSSSGHSIGDNSLVFEQLAAAAATTKQPTNLSQEQPEVTSPPASQLNPNEEEFDSGRGQDDSCSSSTTSGISSTTKTTNNQPQRQSSADNSINDMSSSSSEAAPHGGGYKLPKEVGVAAPKSNSKLKSDQQHSRKLSTVSTMSSQIKLLAKLRANLIPQTNANGGAPFVCCNNKQQSAANNANLGQLFGCAGGGGGGGTLNRQQQLQTLMRMAHHHQQQRARSSGGCGGVSFHPEQKLEELRNLRIQLDRDKHEWQEKFNRMQEQLLNERRELDLAREQLKEDRKQVANEREQLYRKLDLLKEKGILLSPSHKVIITSPEVRLNPGQPTQFNSHQQQQHDDNQSSVAIQYAQTMPPRAKNLIQINQQHHQQQQYPQHFSSSAKPTTLFQVNQSHHQTQIQTTNSIPVHLSQQQQQQQQQHQLSSRMPFISSLPGVHFLAEQFGASL